jgi:hypothetical protein
MKDNSNPKHGIILPPALTTDGQNVVHLLALLEELVTTQQQMLTAVFNLVTLEMQLDESPYPPIPTAVFEEN